jgi:hypothetical protein
VAGSTVSVARALLSSRTRLALQRVRFGQRLEIDRAG